MGDVLGDGLGLEALRYLFHHVFLPPKLPNGDDRSATHDNVLISFIQRSLRLFCGVVELGDQAAVLEVDRMMEAMRKARGHTGVLHEQSLFEELIRLAESGIYDLQNFVCPCLTTDSRGFRLKQHTAA